jgi:hypothetical protein
MSRIVSMLLNIQFLTHYHGGTPNLPRPRELMAWAETEVDIGHVPERDMELTFLEGRGNRGLYDLDRAFSCEGKYWAVVEATNTTDFHWMNREYMHPHRKPGPNGLRNFGTEAQREFSWRAFEYRMMPRQPSKGFRAVNPYNFRSFRPLNVEWSDLDVIKARVNAYYAENLLIAGDTVYCRIDPPCVGDHIPAYENLIARRERRLFTPYGGFGDLIVDFEKAYEAAYSVDSPTELKHARKERAPFFNPIPGYESDPIARGVRALFLSVFGLNTWLVPSAKFPQNEKALEALRSLWQSSLPYLSEAILDEAAEIMLSVAKASDHQAICERWLDRPVHL